MRKLLLAFKKDFWLYLFVALLTEVSGDTVLFGGSIDRTLFNFPLYLMVALLGIVVLKRNYKNDKLLPLIGVLICAMFLSSIINEGTIRGATLLLSCAFVVAYLITTKISFYDFSRIFVNIILIGTLYSIIIWILAIIGLVSLNYYETVGRASILEYGQCYFFNAPLLMRNSFVFREPGLFQIMINMAFLFEITSKDKIDIKHIFIYTVGIFSTLSTAGYITFGALLFMYFHKGKISSYNVFLFAVLAIGIFFVFMQEDLMGFVFDKFNGESGNTRSRSAIISLYILFHDIKCLFFGAGVDNLDTLYASYGSQIFNYHSTINGMLTNTFLNSAATFGIWIFVYFVAGFYLLAKILTKYRPISDMYIVFIVFLLLFSNEAMYYSIFPHLMVFYGFNKKSFMPMMLQSSQGKCIKKDLKSSIDF